MSNVLQLVLLGFALRGLFLLFFTPVEAQTINPVPPTTPPIPQPEPLPPTTPPSISPTVPPQTPELDIPGTIVIERFEFVGNTVFSQEELSQATAKFIGTAISFAQLLQAADRITQLYLEAGYITSGAYIPSQELRTGTVKIQVVEGSLAAINVNVDGRLNPGYVRDRLALATSPPLNIDRLQEALQLLQLNPLIESISAELGAGTRPGTNILDVTVNSAPTFSIRPSLDNNRNPIVGSFRRGIEISEASLLGLGDGLSLAYSNTDGSDQFDVSYTLPFNARNGTLGVSYSTTENDFTEEPLDDIDNDGESPDIEVDTSDLNLTLRQPVLQRATPEGSQELALSLTATRRTSDSELLGVDFPLFPGADEEGKTSVVALRFAQEWTQRGRQQVIAARSQFSLGIDALDSTVNETDPDSQFFVWRGQFLYLRLLEQARESRIGPTLLFRSDIQLAADSLLSLEQFGLGGQDTVRGYRQTTLLRDSGFMTSLEVRLPVFRVEAVQGTFQVAPFVEVGTAWNNNGENPGTDTLVGTGLGLLWQMGEDFSARLDFGIPLVEADDDLGEESWQENGVYFQINYNLNLF